MPKNKFKDPVKIMNQLRDTILERATLWLWTRAVELAPMGGQGANPYAHSRHSSSATGEIANRLDYNIDYERGRGMVGLPAGSSLETVSYYNEFGTGLRGSQLFVSFNSETRPAFTIPIRPKHAKVLAWVSSGTRPESKAEWQRARDEGRAVYAKTTKGLASHPFLRPSLFELKSVYLNKIAVQATKEIMK